jgi:hypothetical protein
MIPLPVFLIAWLILLGIYVMLSLISMMQMVRFGIASTMTYFSTAIFLIVAVLMIGGTGLYLATVDWSLGLDLGSVFQSSPLSL